ncbi:MAG: SDR family oxidoreductase [Planctomycetota bacterium]
MRRVLITGGAKGIGRAIAARFVALGDRVVVTGRDEAALTAAAEALGCDWRRLAVDDEASVAAGFAGLDDLEVCVLNAGVAGSKPIEKQDLAGFERIMEVNATGVFLGMRAALPLLRARGRGRVIVVASTASLRGVPYTGAYTASKHAALGLVRVLASEVAGTGITVNAVCPTFVDTDMAARSVANVAAKTGKSEDEARGTLERMSPLGRFVRPDEVAAAVEFLASEPAACINGQALVLDGGGLQH